MSRRKQSKTPNPRQVLIEELRGHFKTATEAMAQETDPLLMQLESLQAVLTLAKRTSFVVRDKSYKPPRDLFLEIYAFLIGQSFPMSKLNESWDGQGKRPSVAFDQYITFISVHAAQRVPETSQQLTNPLSGEVVSCSSLRDFLAKRLARQGRQMAALAFAA